MKAFTCRFYVSSMLKCAACTLGVLLVLASNLPAYCGGIHDAVKNGDLEKVMSMIKANPNLVFSKDDSGCTPLEYAAFIGRKDIIDFLLANKADVNARDTVVGMNPLLIAADKGSLDVAASLLLLKADINAKDKIGNTPLHNAAQKGYKDMVILLLANKAEVDAKNNYGFTPLFAAAAGGHLDVLKLLLANKADINSLDAKGETPLHFAAEKGNKVMAELLLGNSADVNAKSSSGETPLYKAARSGHKELVEMLLANKADINANNNEGVTPLQGAVAGGYQEIVALLLENEAVIDTRDYFGDSPMHEATENGLAGIVALLRQHGGKDTSSAKAQSDNHRPFTYTADGYVLMATRSIKAGESFPVLAVNGVWFMSIEDAGSTNDIRNFRPLLLAFPEGTIMKNRAAAIETWLIEKTYLTNGNIGGFLAGQLILDFLPQVDNQAFHCTFNQVAGERIAASGSTDAVWSQTTWKLVVAHKEVVDCPIIAKITSSDGNTRTVLPSVLHVKVDLQ